MSQIHQLVYDLIYQFVKGFCQPLKISLQINEDGLGVVVTSFKGGADGKGLRDAVESVVDDLEKVLL